MRGGPPAVPDGGTPTRAQVGFVDAAARLTVLITFGLIPALLTAGYFALAVKPGTHQMVDLRETYLHAARLYMHHNSPFPMPALLATQNGPFYCPPQMAALFVPFALLPFHVAAVLFALVAAVAVPTALWLLDVRDRRVYGAAALSPAVLTAVCVGTSSTLLLLAAAAAWRWRDRTGAVVAAVALAVGTKLFLWPLLVWLWFSGRRTAAVAATGAVAAASALAWSWIGFAGLTSFPALLQRASQYEGALGYAPLAHFGSVGIFLASTVGVLAIAVTCRRNDDLGFLAAIGVALLTTPVLWLHYLALLPLIAIRAPRLGLAWLAPVLLWITPQQLASGAPWRIAIVVGVLAVVGATAVSGSRAATAEAVPSAALA